MKILLTGGSGMVGRAIQAAFARAAHEVIAPSSSALNLMDRAATCDAVTNIAPDLVIHSAGRVGGIAANMAAPADFLIENMDMGLNVVQACRTARVPRLLNLGSSCMYPHEAPSPLHESIMGTGQLEPTNEGYALAKLAVARAGIFASAQHAGLSYKTLVPCNLYGPHDKFDPLRSHLIPAIIRKVHEAKMASAPSVEIWGDGTARREFMYVGDLADCIAQAVARFDALPEMMNVGPGTDHSITDYYRTVADVLGWEGSFTYDLGRPSGMKQKLLDITAQTAYGWAPETSLREGIAQTYRYFLDHALE